MLGDETSRHSPMTVQEGSDRPPLRSFTLRLVTLTSVLYRTFVRKTSRRRKATKA